MRQAASESTRPTQYVRSLVLDLLPSPPRQVSKANRRKIILLILFNSLAGLMGIGRPSFSNENRSARKLSNDALKASEFPAAESIVQILTRFFGLQEKLGTIFFSD